MKNKIHIIPTDKPSKLHTYKGVLNLAAGEFVAPAIVKNDLINQNIYITSDEEIKEDFKGWFIGQGEFEKKCVDTTIINNELYLIDWLGNTDRVIWCKKIILTTDQELINDGVQSIDNEFLEWFINNPSCESVEIEKLCQKEVISEWWENLSDEEMKEVFKQTGNFHLGGWGHDIGPTEEDVKDMYLEVHNLDLKKLNFNVYKIITPKETPKQGNNFYEDLKHYFETTPREKVLEDWNKSAEFDKVAPTIEEFLEYPEQESLEEAAENELRKQNWDTTITLPFNGGFIEGFQQGVKWQQEKSYSEEEVILLLQKYRVALSTGETPNLGDTTAQWFEQFKKK